MFKTTIAIALGLVCSWAAALELNQASSAELQALKGLGPKTAETIVAARKDHDFADWVDLQKRVKGIGSSKSASLSKQGLTVAGKSYTAPVKLQTAAKTKSQ